MNRQRRTLLGLAAGILGIAATRPTVADDSTIEWVVGTPAGGGTDIVARTLAQPMSKTLGRNIFISNRAGGSTNIAAAYVAGHKEFTRILFSADFSTLAANPALFAKLPYDPERDFAPVGLLVRIPIIVVANISLPVNNWTELMAWARTKPDGVTYGSPGLGTPHHLAGELLREQSGVNLVHVAYKGAAPAIQDLLGEHIDIAVVGTPSAKAQLDGRRLKVLGVGSAVRLPTLPDVPTLQEQGVIGYEAYAWQGLVAPAAAPTMLVNQYNAALQVAFSNPDVKARFATMGVEPLPGTPQQMQSYVRAERERWGRLIRTRNIKAD